VTLAPEDYINGLFGQTYDAYLRIEPKGEFADQTRTVVAKIKTALGSQAKH